MIGCCKCKKYVNTWAMQTMYGFVAATCAYTRAIDRSLRAGYRLILVLTLLTNTRADQSERCLPPAPIRTPE